MPGIPTTGSVGSYDMVEDQDVVVAQRLSGLREVVNGSRIIAYFVLWENYS